MKMFLLSVALLFSAILSSNAQTADSITNSGKKCFEEYKAEFAKRGVYTLKDGLHNAVITIRHNEKCEVFDGQARITGGKFELPIFIKTAEGTYIPLRDTGRKINKNYDAYKIPLENKVVNGCSPTYISSDDELVDIFLIDILTSAVKKIMVMYTCFMTEIYSLNMYT